MTAWTPVSIGDIFGVARGGSPRPIDSFITDDADGVNWIMIGDAAEGSKYITKTKKKIKPSGVRRSRMVKPGDFLLTNSMSFGHPYILKTSGCIHDGWLVLSPLRDDLDSDYFYHLLGSPRIYSEFERRAAGATVKNLNIDLVRGLEIRLPPLREQRRIAAILDQADDLRRKRREAQQKLHGMVQAIFSEMFADAVSSASRVSLGDAAREFRYGTSNKSDSLGYPTLRIPNVIGGRSNLDELKYVPVDKEEYRRLALCEGDILIVRTNGNPDYVGRSAVIDCSLGSKLGLLPKDFIFASYLIRARLKNGFFDPVFVQIYLSSDEGRRQIRSFAKTSAGQFNINTESLSALMIPAANFADQQRFAERVARLEPIHASYRMHLSKLDALFASLQHRAFSGELTARQAERELELAG